MIDDEALAVFDGGRPFEGLLVEIHDVTEKVAPYTSHPGAPGTEPIEVDGKVGRCLEWKEQHGKYIVQLFNAHYVLVAEANLQVWEPPVLAEGGFDLCWPSSIPNGPKAEEALPEFGGLVTEVLNSKGWCLIQTIVDDITREEAVHQAKAMPYTAALKAEMIPDYMGRDGKGKVSILTDQGSMELVDGDPPWALFEYDRELTNLSRAISAFTEDNMGFKSGGRKRGMVWAPAQDSAPEHEALHETLGEEDIEAGMLEAHLKFIRQRKLCFVNLIDNKGGEILLFPRQDSNPSVLPVSIPLTPSRLLVYRCDWMSYSYKPLGSTAVSLTTWLLDENATTPDLNLAWLDAGDIQQRSEMMGILVGPPMPTGYRMHAVTMHCRIPGGVQEVRSDFSMLASGVDGFEKIPILRFDPDIYCTGPDEDKVPYKSYVLHCSQLAHSELISFDNKFFGLSDEESHFVGPPQRRVLEDGYITLRNANLTRETLRGRKMAIYLGDTGTDFDTRILLKEAEGGAQNPWSGSPVRNLQASPYEETGVRKYHTVSRLSHVFGMIGNTTSVDTACSAALVGVGTAVQGMRQAIPLEGQAHAVSQKNETDALCMGINVVLNPMSFIALCGAGMLAPLGRCFTFDNSAEGYARGDGFGGLYIRPGESEDTSQQMACFMGVRVNQDGRSATLTAPNGVAQQACIRDSMREAGVVASQITIAECHGTGTALGDPIEVGALRGIMEPRETPLLTTSAKSNIGHQEASAGMVGLIKCCLLVASSVCVPNCHLALLNPHLDVDGFPVYFTSEISDTRLNSNYAGVSSFGFSGTNARADVWSQCKTGPRTASQFDLEKTNQIHVQCPVTMGLIEHLTGEPITKTFRMRTKYKADVLRDEFAPYDISSYAYEGIWRYRREPLLDHLDEELDPEIGIYICGSWSGWTRKDRMIRMSGGLYVATIALGEGCYERFNICVNEDPTMCIYPSIDNASHKIWVQGPDPYREGRNWLIDGRDTEVREGTLYEIRLRWHSERLTVKWEQVEDSMAFGRVPQYQHLYGLFGSFTTGTILDMRRILDEENTWEGSFRLGPAGAEHFAIARDNDPRQVIYPSKHEALHTQVRVCGPDEFASDKRWLVRGPPGDLISVRLHIVSARITVEVSSGVKGAKVWESHIGWERHTYSVVGSWSNFGAINMVTDPEEPGIFRAFGKVGGFYAPSVGCYVATFQVCVEEDRSYSWYPVKDHAGSGEVITMGPDGAGQDRYWLIKSLDPNARFEVILNLNVADRRRIVTWNWMTEIMHYPVDA